MTLWSNFSINPNSNFRRWTLTRFILLLGASQGNKFCSQRCVSCIIVSIISDYRLNTVTSVAEYVTTKVVKQPWLLKPCCAERLKFDKRMPCLFMLEFQGDKILSLCSKSYICVSAKERKLAHKGVNAKLNNLHFIHYENVLTGSTQIMTTNKGIRVWGETIIT